MEKLKIYVGSDSLGETGEIVIRAAISQFETEEHQIEKIGIEKTISRDASRCIGIREKRFICSAIIQDQRRILEIRYNVESQKWRIFQFLS